MHAKWVNSFSANENDVQEKLSRQLIASILTEELATTKYTQNSTKLTLKQGIVVLWDVTIAGPPMCPVWCQLVTDPTDTFTTFTCSTSQFLPEWAKRRPRNTQNGETVLSIANLVADSQSKSQSSYLRFIVIIRLSRLVSEIFACDSQTDRQTTWTITIAGPHTVAGQLIN